MTKRQLSEVHGHSIPELENLLRDSCGIFDDDVNLEKEALGGWSNINILGSSSGTEFVLKLPWHIKPRKSFYDYLHSISKFYSNLGITPVPLASGCLDDEKQTPFILFEYVPGETYQNLNELSIDDLRHFKNCLDLLYKRNPPGLIGWYTPFEYAQTATVEVSEHPNLTECSSELKTQIQKFTMIHDSILQHAEELSWSSTVMHGDLWIPNVVFQSERAQLLDFESCAFGDPHLDLAYLIESPRIPIDFQKEFPVLLAQGLDLEKIDDLRPVALAYIVGWSFHRLISAEAGFVEPNLNTTKSRSAVLNFIQSKLSRLQDIFS